MQIIGGLSTAIFPKVRITSSKAEEASVLRVIKIQRIFLSHIHQVSPEIIKNK